MRSQLFIPCLWNEQHRTECVLCHLRKQASVQIQESCEDIFCLHGESEERPHCECVPLTLQYKPPRCIWEPSVERCGVVWGKGFGSPLLHSAETNTSEVMNKGRVYRGWRSVSHTHTHACTPTRTFLDSGLPGSLGLARILCILSNVCYWALSRLQPVPRLPSNAINCRRAYDKQCIHTHTNTNNKVHTGKHTLTNLYMYMKAVQCSGFQPTSLTSPILTVPNLIITVVSQDVCWQSHTPCLCKHPTVDRSTSWPLRWDLNRLWRCNYSEFELLGSSFATNTNCQDYNISFPRCQLWAIMKSHSSESFCKHRPQTSAWLHFSFLLIILCGITAWGQ